MTIKELEEVLDMTRANIRFYEQEGLLSPLLCLSLSPQLGKQLDTAL